MVQRKCSELCINILEEYCKLFQSNPNMDKFHYKKVI